LLDAGASIDAQNNYGNTALIEAALGWRFEAVKTLLDSGAAVNVANHHGMTAMAYAELQGYEDVIDILRKNRATL
jgi:hypothetical protein